MRNERPVQNLIIEFSVLEFLMIGFVLLAEAVGTYDQLTRKRDLAQNLLVEFSA